jgi:uncharacterized protein YraI
MRSMKMAAVAGLGLLAASAATPSLAAYALNGYATANVNERSGPSTEYPPIVVIPAGAPVIIYGCLSDDTWCDISWNGNRGWMSSLYLQANYHQRRVVLHDYIADLGVPFITFDLGNYWQSHYRNRPFYGQRSRWQNFHPRNGGNIPPPNGNNAPPPPSGGPPPPGSGNGIPRERHDLKYKLPNSGQNGTVNTQNGSGGSGRSTGGQSGNGSVGTGGKGPKGPDQNAPRGAGCVLQPGQTQCP